MDQEILERQIDRLPDVDAVFGIGGGSACDAAKMVSWRTGAKLALMPSILSVDAAFTSAVGVRVGHNVRYIGEVYPDWLLIDFGLLQRAPVRLNVAGVGDILSIFTALHDWKLAVEAVGERYDEDIAKNAGRILEKLLSQAGAIRGCDEEGLKLIAESYVEEVRLCELHGNSRPEEGSEHYFAYCLESLTHKSYIHGELVALGILVAALYQERDVEELVAFMRESGLVYSPEKIGISEREIFQTLVALPAYLERETQLPYGIFHHRGMTPEKARKLIDDLEMWL